MRPPAPCLRTRLQDASLASLCGVVWLSGGVRYALLCNNNTRACALVQQWHSCTHSVARKGENQGRDAISLPSSSRTHGLKPKSIRRCRVVSSRETCSLGVVLLWGSRPSECDGQCLCLPLGSAPAATTMAHTNGLCLLQGSSRVWVPGLGRRAGVQVQGQGAISKPTSLCTRHSNLDSFSSAEVLASSSVFPFVWAHGHRRPTQNTAATPHLFLTRGCTGTVVCNGACRYNPKNANPYYSQHHKVRHCVQHVHIAHYTHHVHAPCATLYAR